MVENLGNVGLGIKLLDITVEALSIKEKINKVNKRNTNSKPQDLSHKQELKQKANLSFTQPDLET